MSNKNVSIDELTQLPNRGAFMEKFNERYNTIYGDFLKSQYNIPKKSDIKEKFVAYYENLLRNKSLLQPKQTRKSKLRTDYGKFTFIMLDIDHFKSTNDTKGHNFGDEILKRFGQELLNLKNDDSRLIRPGDLFSKFEYSLEEKADFVRYGGEEFVILLEDTCTEKAKGLVNKIRKEINKISIDEENNQYLDFTSGIVEINLHDRKQHIKDLFDKYLISIYGTLDMKIKKKDIKGFQKSEIYLKDKETFIKDDVVRKADEPTYIGKTCGRGITVKDGRGISEFKAIKTNLFELLYMMRKRFRDENNIYGIFGQQKIESAYTKFIEKYNISNNYSFNNFSNNKDPQLKNSINLDFRYLFKNCFTTMKTYYDTRNIDQVCDNIIQLALADNHGMNKDGKANIKRYFENEYKDDPNYKSQSKLLKEFVSNMNPIVEILNYLNPIFNIIEEKRYDPAKFQ